MYQDYGADVHSLDMWGFRHPFLHYENTEIISIKRKNATQETLQILSDDLPWIKTKYSETASVLKVLKNKDDTDELVIPGNPPKPPFRNCPRVVPKEITTK